MKQISIKDRHEIEEKFHDAKAIKGVDDFYKYGALGTADRYSIDILGSLINKRILEIGCGDGEVSVQFARKGGLVTCIDISNEMVELTRRRALHSGVPNQINAFHMSGEDLNFPDNSFDVIYGHSILHHLNLDITTSHLKRLLSPNGIAVFLEPIDYNPMLRIFRRVTPSRRTPTEQPLRFDQLELISGAFSSWEHREFYFLSLLAFIWYYGIRSKTLFRLTQNVLQKVDTILFSILPFLRKYAWVTVIKFKK